MSLRGFQRMIDMREALFFNKMEIGSVKVGKVKSYGSMIELEIGNQEKQLFEEMEHISSDAVLKLDPAESIQFRKALDDLRFKNKQKSDKLQQLQDMLRIMKGQRAKTSGAKSLGREDIRQRRSVNQKIKEVKSNQLIEDQVTQQLESMKNQYSMKIVKFIQIELRNQSEKVKNAHTHYDKIKNDVQITSNLASMENYQIQYAIGKKREENQLSKTQNLQNLKRKSDTKRDINFTIKSKVKNIATTRVYSSQKFYKTDQLKSYLSRLIQDHERNQYENEQIQQDLEYYKSIFHQIKQQALYRLLTQSQCLPAINLNISDPDDLLNHLKNLNIQEKGLQRQFEYLTSTRSSLSTTCKQLRKELKIVMGTNNEEAILYASVKDQAHIETYNQLLTEFPDIKSDEMKEEYTINFEQSSLYVWQFFTMLIQKLFHIIDFIGACTDLQELKQFIEDHKRNFNVRNPNFEGSPLDQMPVDRSHSDTLSPGLLPKRQGNRLSTQFARPLTIPSTPTEVKGLFLKSLPEMKKHADAFAVKFAQIPVLKLLVNGHHLQEYFNRMKQEGIIMSDPEQDVLLHLPSLIKLAHINLQDKISTEYYLFKSILLKVQGETGDIQEYIQKVQISTQQRNRFQRQLTKQFELSNKQIEDISSIPNFVNRVFQVKLNQLALNGKKDTRYLKQEYEKYIENYKVNNKIQANSMISNETIDSLGSHRFQIETSPSFSKPSRREMSNISTKSLPNILEKVQVLHEIRGFKSNLARIKRHQNGRTQKRSLHTLAHNAQLPKINKPVSRARQVQSHINKSNNGKKLGNVIITQRTHYNGNLGSGFSWTL